MCLISSRAAQRKKKEEAEIDEEELAVINEVDDADPIEDPEDEEYEEVFSAAQPSQHGKALLHSNQSPLAQQQRTQ